MSAILENQPWTREGYEARKAAIEVRRAEIEPQIASTVTQAVTTYELLRPHAEAVGETALGYPLRHAHASSLLIEGGFGPATTDELFACIGEGHTLSFRKELNNGIDYPLWEVRRVEPLNEELYHETTLQLWSPHSRHRGGQLYDAEVKRWRYGYVDGEKNCGNTVDVDPGVSDYFNGWVNMEDYLEDVADDLQTAKALIT